MRTKKSMTLEKFEVYKRRSKYKLSIYGSHINFSKAIVESLGNPEKVEVLFNEQTNQMAIRKSSEGLAIRKMGIAYRAGNVGLVAEIEKRTKSSEPKLIGEYVEKEKAIVFDLGQQEKTA